jgi:hypothetical protein
MPEYDFCIALSFVPLMLVCSYNDFPLFFEVPYPSWNKTVKNDLIRRIILFASANPIK